MNQLSCCSVREVDRLLCSITRAIFLIDVFVRNKQVISKLLVKSTLNLPSSQYNCTFRHFSSQSLCVECHNIINTELLFCARSCVYYAKDSITLGVDINATYLCLGCETFINRFFLTRFIQPSCVFIMTGCQRQKVTGDHV